MSRVVAGDNEDTARTSEVGASVEHIAEEERLRADCYALLARLLMAQPDAELLQRLAAIDASGSPLGEARRHGRREIAQLLINGGAVQ